MRVRPVEKSGSAAGLFWARRRASNVGNQYICSARKLIGNFETVGTPASGAQ
jgi:hypothetical protein